MTSGANGNGGGTVGFSATANPNGTQRSGSLTIAGQTLSVTQAAAPCTYSINPASQSVAVAGGTGSTAVTAPTGCAWTGVSNDTSWLTVTSGASGSGGGSVAFSATANGSPSQRSGSLTIGGQTLTVTQAGAACTYSINPTSQSVAVAGGTGSATVTTLAGCTWTSVSNSTSWLTVTSGASGNGTGTVAFAAEANPNGTARSGSLTIAGQTFSVTQAAAPCTYSINPASQSVAAAGGTASAAVTAPTGCAWTGVSNNTSWLTVTSGASGNGGGTVGFSVGANPSGTQRSGSLTIGGQTLNVTQAAAPCTYAINPDEPGRQCEPGEWFDERHGTGRLRMDRGQQRHGLVDRDERCDGKRRRFSGLQRVGQCQHDSARRHADRRGSDIDRDPGWRRVHVHPVGQHAVGGRHRWVRVDQRHRAGRLPVVGLEQRQLDHGDGRRQR